MFGKLFGISDAPSVAEATRQLEVSQAAAAEARATLERVQAEYALNRGSGERERVEQAEAAVRGAEREVKVDEIVLGDARTREAKAADVLRQRQLEETEEALKNCRQAALAEREHVVSVIVGVSELLARLRQTLERENELKARQYTLQGAEPPSSFHIESVGPSILQIAGEVRTHAEKLPTGSQRHYLVGLARALENNHQF
jgi:hypothetical protein